MYHYINKSLERFRKMNVYGYVKLKWPVQVRIEVQIRLKKKRRGCVGTEIVVFAKPPIPLNRKQSYDSLIISLVIHC